MVGKAGFLVAALIAGAPFAFGWSEGSSVFSFESPYWDLGLIPILAALVIFAVRGSEGDGRRFRFMLGFEVFGLAAIAAYFISCSRPARWSPVSALLPFQTGLMLSPGVGRRWQDLSFWKILVDLAILASLPLIVASVGGMICAAKVTIRRIAVAVAVIALVLGGFVSIVRRVRRFDDLARYHRSQIIGVPQREVMNDGMIVGLEVSSVDVRGRPVTPRRRLLNEWHARMFQRYRRAARQPWIDVQPESPPPE
jgi:hypothetical protein